MAGLVFSKATPSLSCMTAPEAQTLPPQTSLITVSQRDSQPTEYPHTDVAFADMDHY